MEPEATKVLELVVAALELTSQAEVDEAETGIQVSEPLVHDAGVNDAKFSPDGHWIVTASADGTARLWQIQVAEGGAPAWLPELAEALAHYRITEEGNLESVELEQFNAAREAALAKGSFDPFSRWAGWFFGDR